MERKINFVYHETILNSTEHLKHLFALKTYSRLEFNADKVNYNKLPSRFNDLETISLHSSFTRLTHNILQFWLP